MVSHNLENRPWESPSERRREGFYSRHVDGPFSYRTFGPNTHVSRDQNVRLKHNVQFKRLVRAPNGIFTLELITQIKVLLGHGVMYGGPKMLKS